MHLLHSLLVAYTLAFFRGLGTYSAWIARNTASRAQADCIIIATVLVALVVQSTFPPWLSLTIGIAGIVPYMFTMYMFLRFRQKRQQ